MLLFTKLIAVVLTIGFILTIFRLFFAIYIKPTKINNDYVIRLNEKIYPEINYLCEQNQSFVLFQAKMDQSCEFQEFSQNSLCKSQQCFVTSTNNVAQFRLNNEFFQNISKEQFNSYQLDFDQQFDFNDKFYDISKYPEAYTGYNGNTIWKNIYESAEMIDDLDNRIIIQKLLSGLHASISSFISQNFIDDQNKQYPNLDMYMSKVGYHHDRLQNMQFTFLYMAKALNSYLQFSQINLIEPIYDGQIDIFQNFQINNLKNQNIIQYINKVNKYLNCIDCNKCKLHGKIQIQALETAIKIFEQPNQPLRINEFIALVITVNKLSKSININSQMQEIMQYNLFLQMLSYPFIFIILNTLISIFHFLALRYIKKINLIKQNLQQQKSKIKYQTLQN